MSSRTIKVTALTLTLAAGLGLASTAQATPITFTTAEGEFTPGTMNQGWWSNASSHTSTNANYLVGEYVGVEYRNFFTFDLTSLTGPVTSAVLQLSGYDPSGNTACASPDSSESYGLFDVSAASSALSTGSGMDAGIFADLGSGTSYGTFNVNVADCTNTLQFTLNANGIAAINAAAGGYFSIGGAVQDLMGSSTDQYLFAYSHLNNTPMSLILDSNAVPEPASLGLFGMGMAGIGLVLLRRKRRARA